MIYRTVSPECEAELTALSLSQEIIFVSSMQTLHLVSNPSGKLLSSITSHSTSIHTVRSLPESAIVATAAVGDRFIAVISSDGNKLTHLGSLVCTHDVRTFVIHEQVLLAITVLGTLEVFQSFSTRFDRHKKAGMTRNPDVEIHLKTSHSAKLEVQDAVFRGKETVISWIENAKTGFHNIDISSLSGKVEINVETRKEQAPQQVSHLLCTTLTKKTTQPYQETQALVFTGAEPPTAQVNGTKSAISTDLSFADRLSQLHPQSSLLAPTLTNKMIPSTSSLSTVLTQALNSSDEKLLQTCFQQTHTSDTIHNTLLRLPPPLVPSLLSYFNSVLSRKQKRTEGMLDWIREVVIVHAGYLVAQGDEVKQVLERLKGTLQRRGQSWERLVRLKGRLELLRAVKGREGNRIGREPEVRWVEEGDEEDDEEDEVEDVRYLTGGNDEEESDADSDGNEVEDVEMENGVSSEEDDGDDEEDEEQNDSEDEDEDEPSDESVKPTKKVNGIPHFSDSEDSAVNLDDLIDDEASEASDDVSESENDEDEEVEEGEEEEEEEEEEEILPPKKKSKSKR